MAEYQFNKPRVDSGLLSVQINASEDISQEVAYINWAAPDDLYVVFANALTGDEETALDTLVTNHDAADGGFYTANHRVIEDVPGKMKTESWYQDCDESNVVSNLAKEIVTTWSGNTMESRVEKVYFKCGTLAYETNGIEFKQDRAAKKVLEKRVG